MYTIIVPTNGNKYIETSLYIYVYNENLHFLAKYVAIYKDIKHKG